MTTTVSSGSRAGERDHFIPGRKLDVLSALLTQGGLDHAERDKFRQFCRLLGAIYHYQYFDQLERLRNDYFYFNPELDGVARFDPAVVERAYTDMIDALTKVLHGANFVEVSHAEIELAHREDAEVRLKIKAPLESYREVRFFRRGQHKETIEIADWTGWRKKPAEVGVYDDVVLLVTMKNTVADSRKKKRGRKPGVRPGAVLLKYFRNIACADLNALFPDIRVGMSLRDQLWIGVPALLGGIPIILKLASTLTVLFLVAGFYVGLADAVKDEDLTGALAALGGLVALGGFFLTQWMKYQRQSLLHQKVLSDNIYYRNINNNAGIFDYIIGAAEDQECKEAFLAYHFLLTGGDATADELDRRIEAWLRTSLDANVDFECEDALSKLDQLGLLRRDGDRLSVPPLDQALMHLDRTWDNFFPFDRAPQSAAE